MQEKLSSKRVAILATDGFEQSELLEPLRALRGAGAEVKVVSLDSGQIQGMRHSDKGTRVDVDMIIDDARETDFAGLVLPGGVANPDRLRINAKAVKFVADFFRTGKPVGAICHGPWTLIEADVVRGRKLTSWPSLKTDLKNAGADWVDQEAVVDGELVLLEWERDAHALSRAESEGMGGGVEGRLDEIQHAKRKLERARGQSKPH